MANSDLGNVEALSDFFSINEEGQHEFSDEFQSVGGAPSVGSIATAATQLDVMVNVFVRTCYEQWGRWRNYHLFRIFATFKDEPKVRFSVELILPKMAMEISINENLIYSRLMKSGYNNFPNLTAFVVSEIKLALGQNHPQRVIQAAEYNLFLSQFRRRMSNCMDQTDMGPAEDALASTLGSLREKATLSLQGKGQRKKPAVNTQTINE